MSDTDEQAVWKDRDWLYEQYVVQQRSTNNIAEDFDVNPGAISYWIKKHDIGTRSKSEARSDGDVTKLHDEEWARDEYVEKERSTVDIGEELDVSPSTVRRWLDEHGIETRDSPKQRSNADFDVLDDKEKLRELYHDEELTIQEIANRTSTYFTTVYQRMADFGIERRDNGGVKEYDTERVTDEEYLRTRYVEEEATIEEIANECNCSNWRVHKSMREHGIKTRSTGVDNGVDIERANDGEYLRQRYHEDGWTVEEIAAELNTTTANILRYMDNHGIKRRSRAESLANGDLAAIEDKERLAELYHDNDLTLYEIADKSGLSTTTVFRKFIEHGIEIKDPSVARSNGNVELLYDSEWLEDQYIAKEKSTHQIAKELDLNDETVRQYLIQHDIERRKKSEAVPTAEDHPAWKKNQHDYYGPNWDEKSLKARLRDQARCQSCGDSDAESLEAYGSINFVHHIIPRSEYFNDEGVFDYETANRLTNLITLCPSCHGELEGLPIDNRHNSA